MKKTLIALLFAVLGIAAAQAQTTPPHQVTLTWDKPLDATTTSTATMFRFTGPCASAVFTAPLASGIAIDKPYVDTTVTVGVYCYTVQHVLNGAASPNSNLAPATVLPLPITNVQVTVK